MKSLLLLIEGDDELRPVVKQLQATPVHGAQGSFEGTLSKNTKVIALTTGVGPEQAYRVTADAIRQFAPDYVLSAGTCGALVQGLKVSDWVVTGDVRAIGQANQKWSTIETLRDNDKTAAPRLCQALKQTHGGMREDWLPLLMNRYIALRPRRRSRRSMRRLRWTWKVMASHERPSRKGFRGLLRGSSSIRQSCHCRNSVR